MTEKSDGRPAMIMVGAAVLAVAVIGFRGLIGAAYLAAEVYLPLMLTERFGLRPSVAGLVLTSGAITWSTASWVQGRLGTRGRDVVLLRIGTALIAAGIAI